jgi:hypothetical protein
MAVQQVSLHPSLSFPSFTRLNHCRLTREFLFTSVSLKLLSHPATHNFKKFATNSILGALPLNLRHFRAIYCNQLICAHQCVRISKDCLCEEDPS